MSEKEVASRAASILHEGQIDQLLATGLRIVAEHPDAVGPRAIEPLGAKQLQQIFGLLDQIKDVARAELRRGPGERVAGATIRALVDEVDLLLKPSWSAAIAAEAKPLAPPHD